MHLRRKRSERRNVGSRKTAHHLMEDATGKIINAAIAGIKTTEASKIYEPRIRRPFQERHHLQNGWNQVKK